MTQIQGQMRETYPEAGAVYRYRIEEEEGRFTFELDGEMTPDLSSAITLSIESKETGEGLCRTESGKTCPFAWAWVGPELHLWLDGDLFVFQREVPSTSSARRGGNASDASASGDVLAPMPGAVMEILVAEGDRVEQNQTVMIMESMKMELVITAPRSGVVRQVSVQPGDQVDRGMRLLELGSESGDGE